MLDLAKKTKEISRLFEIKPSRSKGQNFLTNERIYNEIVAAAEIKDSDEVLEVGPGLGFMTVKLAERAKRVVAVELDREIFNYLQVGFNASDNNKVELINEDILRFNVLENFSGPYKIVANLPYNISSIFLRLFLSLHKGAPTSLVLMLQKEVVMRIVAQPPEMSLLALSVQHYGKPEFIREVKAGNFWPEPKVDSAVIKITLYKKKFSPEDDKLFFRLLKAAFSAKRKMLKNNLAGGLQIDPNIIGETLDALKISKSSRAENLSLENWYDLFAAIRQFML